ncbi:MAG TPA: hypothetical protein VM389_01465, partial [Phycisphaerae bacterium]|nr:hypothetical protein [Phycisphaerae bacterium]
MSEREPLRGGSRLPAWLTKRLPTDGRAEEVSRLLGRQVAVAEVKPPLRECFAEVFGFDRVTEGR